MNKKIIVSLSIIAAVAAIVIGGTVAYFSDTETATGNILAAGTIDIAVDGQNPWDRTYTEKLDDMKPSQVRYIEFTVKNVGENPVVLRKHLGDFVMDTYKPQNEPACSSLGGTWNSSECSNWQWGTNGALSLLDFIRYDMTITPQDGSPIEIIPEEWDIKLSDIESLWIPLGTIEPGKTLVVKQSYHMIKETGNWAQGLSMTFDIDLYAEQTFGPGPNTTHGVILENKDDVDWYSIMDQTWGILTWDTDGKYVLRAFGLDTLDTSVTYRLAHWQEPSGPETGISDYFAPNANGCLEITGTYTGFNTNTDAKYRLRPSDWRQPKTLWEGNIVYQQ